MSFLTKEALLAVQESEVFEITTLEDGAFKGQKLKAKPLKAIEQAKLAEQASKLDNNVFQAALWLLYALVDSEDPSKRLFDSGDLDPLLAALDAKELFHLADQVIRKLTKNEVEKELKNSETSTTVIAEDSNISSV